MSSSFPSNPINYDKIIQSEKKKKTVCGLDKLREFWVACHVTGHFRIALEFVVSDLTC